jgi:4-oxalocrotonate tautomerase family enzyme
MPIIRIELLAGRSPAVKQALAAELTEVAARHLGSAPAHIYVMFDDIAHHDWAVAGRMFDNPAPSAEKVVVHGSNA